ncbi:hypothetical protein NEOLEDRAFT_423081 [Neolentinus lepideus HHB14362 ss-1]|uniref:C2H2-type domain-containing protein n=1 Tax=Neolentinus lepideus HHB14362 ss-1 TaxID=1314782 RepID=A0A165S0Q6_9AGAM|nr:hypothetical protein NEOLEDRAFT_423081 [Neolentinus lepideus HHB14362 ss-1]
MAEYLAIHRLSHFVPYSRLLMRSVQSDCELPPLRAMERDYPLSTSSIRSRLSLHDYDLPYPHSNLTSTSNYISTRGRALPGPSARSQRNYNLPARDSYTGAHDEARRHTVREETLARTLARARGESYATSTVSGYQSALGTSHTERAERSYQQGAPPAARSSLSVFNSPTATYMWPSFKAASQMSERPVIYVNYRNGRRSASVNSARVRDVQSDDESYASGDRSPPTTSSSDPGPVREIVEPFNDMGLAGRDRSHHPGGVTSARPNSSHSSYSSFSRFAESSPRFGRSDRDESDSAVEYPLSERSYHTSSRDADEDCRESLGGPERSPRTSPSVGEYDPDRWQEYSTFLPEANQHRCTWVTSNNGVPTTCTYTSRKHLVKRHIQTHHMKIKKWKCEYCGKAFPQKGSLDNHRHTHTGAKPHACHFGCGEFFNDPARRHRHMVEKHNYKPKRSKKNQPDGAPSDMPPYESLHPWRLVEAPESKI